jgi:sterol desaturase/sphingolipid hydroxylase (fatty acid hydroxylase superfamily)
MHRTLHHPRLFSWTHKVHHLSKNPSPFAAMSFQPLEAFLEIVWIVPLAYFLPIEMGVWVIFSLIIILINVLGHLGVEIYPRSWQQNRLLKYLNTSTSHNEHHQYFHGNYSLYFSYWDRWMGTFRK